MILESDREAMMHCSHNMSYVSYLLFMGRLTLPAGEYKHANIDEFDDEYEEDRR